MIAAPQFLWSMNDLCVSIGPSSQGLPWFLDVDVTRPSTGQVESMLWDANAPHGLARRDAQSWVIRKTAHPAQGRDLLILADQGVGDIVQQWRYVQSVASRHRVRVLCRPEVRRFLRRQSPDVDVAESDGYRADTDAVRVSLMRLGSLSHDATLGNPYLTARSLKPASLSTRLRVGLNWTTSKAGVATHVKSLPPALLEQVLRDYPEIDWVSVQWGEDERWLSSQPWAAAVEPLGRGFTDVADLADAIAGLDLLITTDSAPAHIAGALGVSVWTLLSRPCSWRWGLTSSTTPLYSGMRLIRQSTQGDWAAVMAQVHRMLGGILRLPGTANFLLARPWEDMSCGFSDQRATPGPGAPRGLVVRSVSLDEALRMCREKEDWRAAFVFRPLALLATLGVRVWGRDYSGLAKVFKTMVDCHEGFSWCTPLHD